MLLGPIAGVFVDRTDRGRLIGAPLLVAANAAAYLWAGTSELGGVDPRPAAPLGMALAGVFYDLTHGDVLLVIGLPRLVMLAASVAALVSRQYRKFLEGAAEAGGKPTEPGGKPAEPGGAPAEPGGAAASSRGA